MASRTLLDNMNTLNFLRELDRPAIYSGSTDDYITHAQLRQCVQSFRLPGSHSPKKAIVAVALPNGPLLAAGVIAVSTYYVAAPITPGVGVEQFKADVTQAGANIILTTKEDYQRLELGGWTADAGIQVCLTAFDSNRSLSIASPSGSSITDMPAVQPNSPHETCIQLFTSGTSGNKKIVPISMAAAMNGAQCVIESWGLTPEETCLNMMPLHHV
jgi:acyl-coenzyme A synthetase/AMP-(fatty) acid ligase